PLVLLTTIATADTARPESVGLSSARLEHIGELLERHIAEGDLSGAVTLVARNGEIAHPEAHGVANIADGAPMQTDAIFRIASMTKPVVSTAVMLLVEEGKLRLTDPVARYLPAFAELEVGVQRQQRVGLGGGAGAGPGGGPGGGAPSYYTVPAE